MAQFPMIPGPGNTMISSSVAPTWYATDPIVKVNYVSSSAAIPNSLSGISSLTYAVDATAGAVNLTLPPMINGSSFYFKKIDSSANAVNIYDGYGAKIDGVATQSLSTQYSKIRVLAYSASLWLVY